MVKFLKSGGKPTTAKRVLLMRARLYRGLPAKVARKLKVSESAVSQVQRGKFHSPRIEAALIREMRRVERRIERAVESGPQQESAA